MSPLFSSSLSNLMHLFFPHNCEGCGTTMLDKDALLCSRCLLLLPATGFFGVTDNPVERSFYGRLDIRHAGAAYYFTKDSLLQHLLIQLKYKHYPAAGLFLGRMMGRALANAGRLQDIDGLVPVPLNPKKLHQRGYNQSALICEGIASQWPRPVLNDVLTRSRFTETQTKRGRSDRWQNMQGVFIATETPSLKDKHLLLVDDVITTGATLEACGEALLKITGVQISIGAVGYTV